MLGPISTCAKSLTEENQYIRPVNPPIPLFLICLFSNIYEPQGATIECSRL